MSTVIQPVYDTWEFANLDSVHSHRVAILFVLLASGMAYDLNPFAVVLADRYHLLACGALGLDSILEDVTTSTVQALFMVVHHINNSDRANNETKWLLWGICTRAAQKSCVFF